MSDNSNSEAIIGRWLCWISRVLLLAASLSRFFYTTYVLLFVKWAGTKFWNWDKYEYTIPIIIVTIIAWFKPRAGGILTLVWLFIRWLILFYHFATQQGDNYLDDWSVVLFESGFLLIGGILSIIWGVWQRKNKG